MAQYTGDNLYYRAVIADICNDSCQAECQVEVTFIGLVYFKIYTLSTTCICS
jgi:hypothetical protein